MQQELQKIFFVVLSMDKIIEEEQRLSRDYRYPLSETAQEVLRLGKSHRGL